MAMLGVPYGEAVKPGMAEKLAREQAEQISAELVAQGGRGDLTDRKIIALVAYLQRLGTDISKPVETPAEGGEGPESTATPTAAR